jgi:hypothetical protein
MIRGYTEEGNAILFQKGNVEALTEAYNEQIKAAQAMLTVGSSDAFKGFKAKTSDWAMWGMGETPLDLQLGLLEQIRDDIEKTGLPTKPVANFYEEFGDSLKKAGIDATEFYNALKQENKDYFQDSLRQVNAGITTLTKELNAEALALKPYLINYLDTSQIAPEVRDSIKDLFATLDYDFFRQFNTDVEMYTWVQEKIIDPLNDPSISKQIQDALKRIYSIELPKTEFV